MMEKIGALLVGAALMLVTGTAMAIPLATYTHDYGIGLTHPSGTDVLGPNYVTVNDNEPDWHWSNKTTFNDSFDFSSLIFSKIERFDLIFTYTGINYLSAYANNNLANWAVLLNSTTGLTYGSTLIPNGQRGTIASLSPTSTYIYIADYNSTFYNNMLANKKVSFGFEEGTYGNDSFNLSSVSLTILGEQPIAVPPVPEPGTMMLLGVGIFGLAVYGKRRKNC